MGSTLFRAYVVGGLVGLLLACSTGGEYREDVLYCEASVARLVECCPGLDPSPIACGYAAENGCWNDARTTTYPTLTLAESVCILDKDCSELTPAICERARAATPRRSCSGWLCDGESANPPPVCS